MYISLREISRRINVSVASVSKALNNRQDVSEEVRALIRDLIIKNRLDKLILKEDINILFICSAKTRILKLICCLALWFIKGFFNINISIRLKTPNEINRHLNAYMRAKGYDACLTTISGYCNKEEMLFPYFEYKWTL